jgi:beta-N-acetylhexosaminidase
MPRERSSGLSLPPKPKRHPTRRYKFMEIIRSNRLPGISMFCLCFMFLPFLIGLSATRHDSLDLKIGQMIMRGFRGLNESDNTRITSDVSRLHLGGVILFDYDVERKSPVRNIASPDQVRALTAALQKASELPLLIAIDQEGGRVNRLKPKNGFPPSVSQSHLGKVNNADTTRFHAERTARLLAGLGINLNFTPVVDLNVNRDNPVIGKLERSFSADPEQVIRHAGLMMDAFHAHGILTAIKHFPGHGSSHADSHEGFVDVTPFWSRVELEPFAQLIHSGKCDIVMTAHIWNEKLDARYPATLSERILQGILRDSLGFSGVIISDDMQMKAIASSYGLETAIEKALLAGVDILLFGNNTGSYDEDVAKKAIDIVRTLVEKGVITESRIDDSYQRIQRLKNRLPKRGE